MFSFRVDDLYKYLNHWVPELYGELGDVTERGYILVDSDTELSDDETGTATVKVIESIINRRTDHDCDLITGRTFG
jgi:hypothetical protein